MMLQIVLLILIILNLMLVSILAFTGRKNLLLFFAVLEAILAFIFAYTF